MSQCFYINGVTLILNINLFIDGYSSIRFRKLLLGCSAGYLLLVLIVRLVLFPLKAMVKFSVSRLNGMPS